MEEEMTAVKSKIKTTAEAKAHLSENPLGRIDFLEIYDLLSDRVRADAKTNQWGIEVEVCGSVRGGAYAPWGWDGKEDSSLCESDYDDRDCTCIEEGYRDCCSEPDDGEIAHEVESDWEHRYAECGDFEECWCYCSHHDLHALPENDARYISADDCALYDHGIDSREYEHRADALRDDWYENHEHDDDCRGYYFDCSYNCMGYEESSEGESIEIVSPILNEIFPEGLGNLTSMLPEEGCSCSGVHVHVDAEKLTVRQLSSLTWGWMMVGQDLVDYEMGRSNVMYARAWNEDDHLRVEALIKRVVRPDYEPRYSWQSSDPKARVGSECERYKTLNLSALEDHGTVEFRGMSARYDHRVLTAWASVCRGFVALAAAGMSKDSWLKIKDTASYVEMLKKKTGKVWA